MARRRTARAVRVAVMLVALALFTAACGVPRDIHDTLQEVEARDAIRAGAIIGGAATDDGSPVGAEADAVEEFAAQLGVGVEWSAGTEQELMRRLERRELDVVVGGIEPTSPYGRLVAFTVRIDEHVVAVPPGENRWLLRWDRFLNERRGT